jgi:hypothetical protein
MAEVKLCYAANLYNSNFVGQVGIRTNKRFLSQPAYSSLLRTLLMD